LKDMVEILRVRGRSGSREQAADSAGPEDAVTD